MSFGGVGWFLGLFQVLVLEGERAQVVFFVGGSENFSVLSLLVEKWFAAVLSVLVPKSTMSGRV